MCNNDFEWGCYFVFLYGLALFYLTFLEAVAPIYIRFAINKQYVCCFAIFVGGVNDNFS